MVEVGVLLGSRYLLVDLIGRGGMGQVWSAQDTVLDRRVAVKVLLPNLAGDPGFAARFRAEARAMAALSHPGIIEIYDYGQADGLAYLVMQFVEGESLATLMRRAGRLAPDRAMRLVVQAAEAIEAAHRHGIIHRDVKPANLLLRPDGRVALTDFGIARILANDRLTAADQIVGTSSYLAPEQVTGEQISPATDVYALGLVAYELLAGGKPFSADTPFGVALKHVHEEPPPLPASVPGPMRELVMRAMAKDPAQRWPSAAAFAHAALVAIGEATTVSVPRGTTAQPAVVTDATTIDEPDDEITGETTRTTRRPAPVWGNPGRRPRKRLLLAAGAATTLAIAAVLIVTLSPDGAGQPQTQGSSPSASAAAAAIEPSTVPAQNTATPSSGARTGSPAPTSAANPSQAGPGAQTNPPPPTTAKVPNMYGWKENEVKAEMTRLGLVTRITYRWVQDKCFAIEWTPTTGTVVPAGSTIDVVIAKNPGPGPCLEV